MIDSSSSYEDDLNILLDKLQKTISTFNTLSREQAEFAILDTTSKIKDGESIIKKIEEELESNIKNYNPEELMEERKKIKDYRSEFNDIVSKFTNIRDSYINKKTKNALIEEEPKIKNDDLISNEEKKNNNYVERSKEEFEKNKKNEIKNEAFENNIGNISWGNNAPNHLAEDAFDTYNKGINKKTKRKIMIGLIITFLLVVTFIVVIAVFGNKK